VLATLWTTLPAPARPELSTIYEQVVNIHHTSQPIAPQLVNKVIHISTLPIITVLDIKEVKN